MRGNGGFRGNTPRAVKRKAAELTAPAFQCLLAAGGDVYAPRGEGGFDNRNHYRQAALETAGDGSGTECFAAS